MQVFFFFFNFMRACGPARTGRGPMRAEPARACELTILAPPHFFCEPVGQTLIVILEFSLLNQILLILFDISNTFHDNM